MRLSDWWLSEKAFPRNASFATPALKAAVNVRRFAMLTPFNPGEVHLNALSEIPGPPLWQTLMTKGKMPKRSRPNSLAWSSGRAECGQPEVDSVSCCLTRV